MASISSVVIVHGKYGSPKSGWIPWFREQARNIGLQSIAPAFPPEDSSKLSDWIGVLDTLDLEVDFSKTVFVAHARGATALLRWIDGLPFSTRIPAVITVSCNFPYQPQRTDGDRFYSSALDYEDLRRKCGNFVIIHSADDPYVPIAAGQQLAKDLQARFVGHETAGHFGSEKLEAPEIMAELETLVPNGER